MPASLVLLPTYNERENLTRILPRLAAFDELDVLVIDDSSPDGTGELAEELRSRYAHLSVLHRRKKEGLGKAYIHGFREALRRGYRRVVTMDADLSHSPEDVPRLLDALEHADVAVGSRHVEGGGVESWPLWRRALSRAGSFYARKLLGIPVRDVTGGFKAYHVDAIARLDLASFQSSGFVFQVEVLRKILDLPGARAVEVPIVFRNREHGESKISRSIVTEAAAEVVRLLWRKPAPEHVELRGGERTTQPAVSVIVPVLPECDEPEALRGLAALQYPNERVEALIVRGKAPARQRNLAAASAMGEYLLFLDDDSTPAADLLERYVETLERSPGVAAVGGPSTPSAESNGVQRAAALVLSEPWAVGKTASRYRALGRLRESDERELILCNLCLRRSAFEEAGGFDERLYPNEENELLERLRRSGWKLIYDPGARVARPHRASLGAYLRSIFGYGRGRGEQTRCLPSRSCQKRVAVLIALLLVGLATFALGAFFWRWIWSLPLLLGAAYSVALGARLVARGGVRDGVSAVALALLTHAVYSAGMICGLLRGAAARHSPTVALERIWPANSAQAKRNKNSNFQGAWSDS